MRSAAWFGLAALTIACTGERASFLEGEGNKVTPAEAGADKDDHEKPDDDDDRNESDAGGDENENGGSSNETSESDAKDGDTTDSGTSSTATAPATETAPPSVSETQPEPTSSAEAPATSATEPGTEQSTTTTPTVSASPTETTVPTGPEAPSASMDPGAGGSGETPPDDGANGGGGAAEPLPTDPDELVSPAWSNVPCTARTTDSAGQGPFFIHDLESDEDIDLFRQDIRGKYNSDAEDGIEMQLHLRIVGASDDCSGAPLEDADIYVWHTDAQGYFSGFGMSGDQNPDQPYTGVPGTNDLENLDRFCRGAQTTNEDGVVSFRTYFPGWMNGRDVHIHILALRHGSASQGRVTYSGGDVLFMTNLYFEPAFTDSVHQSAEPYKRRTALAAYQGAIKADEPGNSGLRAKATFEDGIVVAQLQLSL